MEYSNHKNTIHKYREMNIGDLSLRFEKTRLQFYVQRAVVTEIDKERVTENDLVDCNDLKQVGTSKRT